jgi:hypothetical protein
MEAKPFHRLRASVPNLSWERVVPVSFGYSTKVTVRLSGVKFDGEGDIDLCWRLLLLEGPKKLPRARYSRY